MNTKEIDEILSSRNIDEYDRLRLIKYLLQSNLNLEDLKKALDAFNENTIPLWSYHLGSSYLANAYTAQWHQVPGPTKAVAWPKSLQEAPQFEFSEQIFLLLRDNFESLEKFKDETQKQIISVEKELEDLRKENLSLKKNFYNFLIPNSDTEKIQFIPVDIYLDTFDNNTCFNVYASVINFLRSIEFDISLEFDAIKGSWIKRMLANSQRAITSKEVTDRLREAEYGIEVNTILKEQSLIDKNQSEALLNILKSVENVPNAAIRIGSLLVVKLTNKEGEVNVQVRSLSIAELHILNKKPDLLHSPQHLLTALTKVIQNSNEAPSN